MDVLTESIDWTQKWIARARSPATRGVICLGGSIVDCRSGFVETGRGIQKLRRKELQLLAFLYEHLAATFSRAELLRQVWRCEATVLTRTVDQTVATLRRKIGDDSRQPKYLLTVYGIGYQLTDGQVLPASGPVSFASASAKELLSFPAAALPS